MHKHKSHSTNPAPASTNNPIAKTDPSARTDVADPRRNPEPDISASNQRPEEATHEETRPEETIRIRAYEMWEKAGRPDGDGVYFWLEAERELNGNT
jgi:hypothetical protein